MSLNYVEMKKVHVVYICHCYHPHILGKQSYLIRIDVTL
jgi:hypothetical protein